MPRSVRPRNDIDDGTHAAAAVFGGKGAREDVDGLDVARIDELGKIRTRALGQRRAVKLVGESVESVSHGLVI